MTESTKKISEGQYIGPYTLSKTLQRGSLWKVKLGLNSTTGEQVSVRIIKKSTLHQNNEFKLQTEREIKILRLLDHPNIIRLHDVLQTPKHLFVVTEHLAGGELFDVVQRDSNAPNYSENAQKYCRQLMSAVLYLSKTAGICHRDIKLENIHLDLAHNIRLVNFTVAAPLVMIEGKPALLETMCGSRHYACPEIVQGQKYDGAHADVWSCGVVIYALNTLSLPFDDDDNEALFHRIRTGAYYTSSLSPNLKDLLSRMLCVNPAKRASAADLVTDPYLQEHMNTPPAGVSFGNSTFRNSSIRNSLYDTKNPVGTSDYTRKTYSSFFDTKNPNATVNS